MTQFQTDLLSDLCRLGIVEVGEFTLKHHEVDINALKSPFKINLKIRDKGPLIPDAVRAIAAELYALLQSVELVKKIRIDRIVGVPSGGDPFAKELAILTRKPLLTLERKIIAGTSRMSCISKGDFNPGEHILLIEDVLTRGYSGAEAIVMLQKAGLVVPIVFAGVDRNQGGARYLNNHFNCGVRSVFSIFSVFERLFATGLMSQEEIEKNIEYINTQKCDPLG
ncbi:MAG: hypothetical protein ABIA08_01980 [bacterium]